MAIHDYLMHGARIAVGIWPCLCRLGGCSLPFRLRLSAACLISRSRRIYAVKIRGLYANPDLACTYGRRSFFSADMLRSWMSDGLGGLWRTISVSLLPFHFGVQQW